MEAMKDIIIIVSNWPFQASLVFIFNKCDRPLAKDAIYVRDLRHSQVFQILKAPDPWVNRQEPQAKTTMVRQ